MIKLLPTKTTISSVPVFIEACKMIIEVLVGLLVAILVYGYMRLTKRYGVLDNLGIPVEKPFLCFGSGPWLIHKYKFHEYDLERQKKYGFGTKTYGFYDYSTPVIHTIDPEVIKEVFIKQFDKFQERMDFGFDETLMTMDIMKGEGWKELRKLIGPSLTSGKIKAMMDPIDEVTGKASRYLKRQLKKSGGRYKIEDSKVLYSIMTLEVIMKVAFGVEGKLIDDDKIHTDSAIVKQIKDLMVSFTANNVIDDIFIGTFLALPELGSAFTGQMKTVYKYYEKMTRAVINSRNDANAPDSGDFIDRLRDGLAKVKESGGSYHGLNEQLVLNQGVLFILAGYETTASTLNMCSYYLSKNKEIQDRCYQDIADNVDKVEDINYQSVTDMKYLEATILETLRIDPLLTRNQRLCETDTVVCGMNIKKGVRFEVPVYPLHLNPEVWGDDAETFNPDRFVSGGKTISDINFHSFGLGPRQCIGMRMAMKEAMIMMANLLYQFEFVNNPDHTIQYSSGSIFQVMASNIECIIKERA